MSNQENIHIQDHRFLAKSKKAQLLGQEGAVLWLYGLSGSGKSTIAAALEKRLFDQKRFAMILDGDNLRSGLNADLGFSDEDRKENVRRVAEISKVISQEGVIVLVAVITPLKRLREMARKIVGSKFREIYIKSSLEVCIERDPKGLYAKVEKGGIKDFTGFGSGFEDPEAPDLLLDTGELSVDQSVDRVVNLLDFKGDSAAGQTS